MDVARLDKNLAQEKGSLEDGYKAYTLPCENIDLYGVTYNKELGFFERMPYETAKKVSYCVEVLSTTTAGARARFKTNAKSMVISIKYRYLAHMNNMPRIGASGFTQIEIVDGKYYRSGKVFPTMKDEKGYTGKIGLAGEGVREYILFFPLYNDYIEEITLGFEEGSIVEGGSKYKFDLPILYYGSSITQGAAASRSDNCYQAYISEWNNVDYINLGFSGSAKAEDVMLDYLATIKSKVYVLDYDHNAPNPEHLRKTHYKAYKTYREANPDTPIIMMSKPDFSRGCTTERIRIIKNTYDRAKKEGDNNVYFIDGRRFFGKVDREHCTADGCHPNDLGFYRMAKVLQKVIKPLLGE